MPLVRSIWYLLAQRWCRSPFGEHRLLRFIVMVSQETHLPKRFFAKVQEWADD